MIANGLRERIIINFLCYYKKLSIESAKRLYSERAAAIDTVFDLIGDKTMINLLNSVEDK